MSQLTASKSEIFRAVIVIEGNQSAKGQRQLQSNFFNIGAL